MPDWNKAQLEVLDSLNENTNVLVSAAAGSGKTAVLVERIIRTIISGMASADEILVVTFTKAAAAQMKRKILKSLEIAAGQDETGRMSAQLCLAENADITTIDSFCNKVVRDNFSIAGVDPAFEIYDKEEVELLKDDVLDEVLGEYYRDNKTFEELTPFLMNRNIDDSDIKETILRIFRMSESYADSLGWLEEAREKCENKEDILNTKWVRDYVKYFVDMADSAYEIFSGRYSSFDMEPEGKTKTAADKLSTIYQDDMAKMYSVKKAKSLQEISAALETKWINFPHKAVKEAYGEDMDTLLFSERKSIIDFFKKIYSSEIIIEQADQSKAYLNCLIDIVISFRNRLMDEKKKLKKYEFADIAHMAFNILYDVNEDRPTVTGQRMASIYKYIYIDEYQDSNDLQENLLNAVARRNENGDIYNVFMVGDVKQSIYKFRLARPELFTNKSDIYRNTDKGRLIDLNTNYRSRKEILDASNFICRDIMRKSFGGIEYDENAQLHVPEKESYENNYPPATEEDAGRIGGKTELLLINAAEEMDEYAQILSDEEAEAVVIGRKIKLLVEGDAEKGIEPMLVVNEEFNKDKPVSQWNPKYRKAKYGDIVILQRKVKGSTTMVRIYEQMGIPVVLNDSSGYFDAMEIVTMLSVLRVVDNVQQDIPLASVLLSHMGGLTDEELAHIVSLSFVGTGSLADKLKRFMEGYLEHDDAGLKAIAGKLDRIMGLIKKWREIKPYVTVSDLINIILDDTNYRSFAEAMPEGKRRVANLDMLCTRADVFGTMAHGGLLDFVRYIDKCRIHEIDFSEASVSGNFEDSVKIMSIHKSKGLEFPIVILGRTSNQFMLRDTSKKVVVNSDYHVAMDYMRKLEGDILIKDESVKKNILKLLEEKAVKTEETRLLYVGMTRAKEKLIITGTYKKAAPAILSLSKCLLDFIRFSLRSGDGGVINTQYLSKNSITADFNKRYIKNSVDYSEDVQSLLADIRDNRGSTDMEQSPYSFEYPYMSSTKRKAKLSVSEIKHAEMDKHTITDASDEIVTQYPDEEQGEEEKAEKLLEAEKNRERAATRGTVIHAVFELMDYSRVDSRPALEKEFRRVLNDKRFSDEERKLVNIKALSMFYSDNEDSLFVRMKRAASENKLKREKQFIAGLRPDEIPGNDEYYKKQVSSDEEDYTVIQGIIDAFFYEGPENDIILVDYKTDNVKEPSELLGRYASQMYLYALTLEKLTGHIVKDVVLYSTRIGEIHYNDWRNYGKGEEAKNA